MADVPMGVGAGEYTAVILKREGAAKREDEDD